MNDQSELPSCERPKRANRADSDTFILTTRFEQRYDEILNNVFMRSTEENPSIQKIRSGIKLSNAVRDEKQKRFITEKRRQQIHDRNQELKLLEEQLRAAYVKRTIEAQIFENKAIKNMLDAQSQDQCAVLAEAELDKDAEAKALYAKQKAYKNDLLQQITEVNALRLMNSEEELLKEKRLMDEHKRKCEEDKIRHDREVAEKKLSEWRQMEEFKRAREEFARAQNQASEEEDEKISEMIRQREIAQQKALQEKREQQEKKDAKIQEIGRQMHAIAVEKIRRGEILTDLLCDERQAKDEMRARHELEKHEFQKISTRLAFEKDFEDKERRRQHQEKIDKEFYEQEMRDLAERDRLHLLSDEKRRKKVAEHRRALLESLNQKKMLKANAVKEDIHERDRGLREAELEHEEIEYERERMLREHVPGLIEYLAPSVVKQYLSLQDKGN